MACSAIMRLVQLPAMLDHTTKPVFERPPEDAIKTFELLFPIMSRLPSQGGEQASIGHDDDHDSYLQPGPVVTLPGTLPYSKSHGGITYTRSRLPRIDDAAGQLWKALHIFRPVTTDYAGDFHGPVSRQVEAPHPISYSSSSMQCPFVSARSRSSQTALDLVRRVFNWSSICLPASTSGTFYGVIFRSKRAKGSESTNLYAADRLAHEEAVASGGLLMYFYGAPDPITGANLATCIWTSRIDALEASALPLHAEAATHSRKAYESFELSRYRVLKVEGERHLRVEEWDRDE